MHAADQIGDLIRYPDPMERLFHGGALSEQFVEGVQAGFFLLQRP